MPGIWDMLINCQPNKWMAEGGQSSFGFLSQNSKAIHPLGYQPCLPWQSEGCFLILQDHYSELLSPSHPSLISFTIKRWPSTSLHTYLSIPLSIPSPPCLFLSCPSKLFQRKKHLSSFAVQHLHLCFITSCSMCVEQTASGSDLDLNPSSNMLQLFPASLLLEYGNYVVTVVIVSFSNFCETTTWHSLACQSVCTSPSFPKAHGVTSLILHLWACHPCLKCP